MITKTPERTDVGVQNTASCVDRAGADPLRPLACAQEPKRLNEPRHPCTVERVDFITLPETPSAVTRVCFCSTASTSRGDALVLGKVD
jgi:hypothetical protein